MIRSGPQGTGRVQYPDGPALIDKSFLIGLPDRRKAAGPQEETVILFKIFPYRCRERSPVYAAACHQTVGGSGLPDLFRKLCLVDIESGADHNIPDLPLLQAHLCQDTGQFPIRTSVDGGNNIIGPFDAEAAGPAFLYRQIQRSPVNGQRHDQGDHGRRFGTDPRPEQDAHIYIDVRGRDPGPTPASPAACLHGGHDQGTFRRSLIRQLNGILLSSQGLFLIQDRSAGPVCPHTGFQPLPVQQVRAGDLPQPVSPVGHRLDRIAFLPELSDSLPDSCPGNPQTLTELLAGHISVRLLQFFQNLFFRAHTHSLIKKPVRVRCSGRGFLLSGRLYAGIPALTVPASPR